MGLAWNVLPEAVFLPEEAEPLTTDMEGVDVLPPERREDPPAEASVLPPVTPLPVRSPVFLFP